MNNKCTNREEQINENVIYCTECGEKLENFCFSPDVGDLGAVQRRHEECKKVGKFKGDLCSRLFIAEPINPDSMKVGE
jgi:hypothetical protein